MSLPVCTQINVCSRKNAKQIPTNSTYIAPLAKRPFVTETETPMTPRSIEAGARGRRHHRPFIPIDHNRGTHENDDELHLIGAISRESIPDTMPHSRVYTVDTHTHTR